MRVAIALSVLLGISGMVLVADDEPTPGDSLRNDVTPDEKAWSRHESGLQVQVRAPRTMVDGPVTSLLVVVWFRNPTDDPITLRVVAPAFTAHGEVEVRDESGLSRVGGECCKKHDSDSLLFAPGQLRGFLCDALAQSCYRVQESGLAAGTYQIGFKGSVGVELQVR